MIRVIALFGLAAVFTGCGGSSTGELVNRCDLLFNGIAAELEHAIRAIDEGKDSESVINSYKQPIEELASKASQLRKDLAVGGQRHGWTWPLLMRSESVIRYEVRLGAIGQTMGGEPWFLHDERDSGNEYALAKIPESLTPLGQIGRAKLKELRWFCNRVASAGLPDVPDSDLQDFTTRWRIKGLAGYDTELMRALQTDEEADAFRDYVIRRESL